MVFFTWPNQTGYSHHYKPVTLYTVPLISFPDLLRTKPKARSGQLRDHLSGMWQGRQVRMPNIFGAVNADFVAYNKLSTGRRHDLRIFARISEFRCFHKTKQAQNEVERFFHNLAGFVFQYFCDSRRILATFAKFCLNSLLATWSYRFTRHPARARSSSPPSPTQVFWRKKFLQNPPPSPNCYRQISLKRFWYLLPTCCFRAEIGRPGKRKKKCEHGEGFVKFCVKKAWVGDGGELERALDDVFGI